MYYKCCKIDSHSSATNFGFDKKLKIDFPVCTIYSIRIAICISGTAIYCDAVLVGDTQPYFLTIKHTNAHKPKFIENLIEVIHVYMTLNTSANLLSIIIKLVPSL